VAIDGVSLTVAAVRGVTFSVALIPTTLEQTTLSSLKAGDRVNVESDIIARTIVHHLTGMSAGGGLTLESLREAGFA
jgi:riboflavin synthase